MFHGLQFFFDFFYGCKESKSGDEASDQMDLRELNPWGSFKGSWAKYNLANGDNKDCQENKAISASEIFSFLG